MPLPNDGESESHFVRRYINDPESKFFYPHFKQRLKVAYEVYEKNAKPLKPNGVLSSVYRILEKLRKKYFNDY